MPRHSVFGLATLDGLVKELAARGLELPARPDTSVLARPLSVGGLVAPNRLAVHPMEGYDGARDGSPSELTVRRYRRFAAGGSGMIWFEATAVVPEGRSNPRQLWLHAGSLRGFRELVRETRTAARFAGQAQPLLVLQLTHSGRYSRPGANENPVLVHHDPVLDAAQGLPDDSPLISDDALDHLQDAYVSAAQLAREAGFDAVDVKSCHRYLVSELLAARTRDGRYAGDYDGRTRFLRQTVARIGSTVPDLVVATRLGVYDAHPYPWGWGVSRFDPSQPDLAEPLRLVGDLADSGVALVSISAGNPRRAPHVCRPYDRPLPGSELPDEHPLEGVVRLCHLARAVQSAAPNLPVVSAGLAWLRDLMPYVAAGLVAAGWTSVVGQGRGALAYPDAPSDMIEKGRLDRRKCCITCSGCSRLMRASKPVGCVVRDAAAYRLA